VSAKEKLNEPVVYSRNSWSYRRWVQYWGGKQPAPKNSCEYRSVVFFRLTGRQVGTAAGRVFRIFKKPSSPNPKPRPVTVIIHDTRPHILWRVMWTMLWPFRKFVRALFVSIFRAVEVCADFNDRHHDKPTKVFCIFVAVVFVGLLAVVLVAAALKDPIQFLIVVGLIAGMVAAWLLVCMGGIAFLKSDFATAVGDFFVSFYYRMCRPVDFRD